MSALLQEQDVIANFGAQEKEARLRYLFLRFGTHLEPCARLLRLGRTCSCGYFQALEEIRQRPLRDSQTEEMF